MYLTSGVFIYISKVILFCVNGRRKTKTFIPFEK